MVARYGEMAQYAAVQTWAFYQRSLSAQARMSCKAIRTIRLGTFWGLCVYAPAVFSHRVRHRIEQHAGLRQC